MNVELPDGTIIEDVPEGTTRAQLVAKLKRNGYDTSGLDAKPESSSAANALGGLIRGAGSIGATIMTPIDAAARAVGISNDYIGRTDRREAMDGALRSLGADPESGVFQAGKIGGEIAGTAGVGPALAAGARAAPLLSRAAPLLESAGMSAPGFSGASGLAARAAAGGATGAASGLAINPDEALAAGVIGAAIPGGIAAAGRAGQAVGSATAAFSDRAAQAAAIRQARKAIDDDPAVLSALRQTSIPGANSIPLSAAARANSPELAALEARSRLRSATDWTDFDAKQASALWNNVLDATSEAGELGARKAQRRQNWQDNWNAAAQAVDEADWSRRARALDDELKALRKTPDAVQPQVRDAVDMVRRELASGNVTPAHLQVLRAELNGRVPMTPQNALKGAPRDNPATIALIDEIDDTLSGATRGGWDKVRQGYAADSKGVAAAKAAGLVREGFMDTATGRVRGVAADGDVPRVTEAGIGRAMDRARLPDKSLAMSARANQQLEATLEAIRRQNLTKRVKGSATAGAGSDTAFNLGLLPGAQHGLLSQALGLARRAAVGRTDDELARLLMSPEELAQALSRTDPQALSRLGLLGARLSPALATD